MKSVLVLLVVTFAVIDRIECHMSMRGKCPHIPAEPNFDVERFAGTWYAIEKTPPIAPCVSYDVEGTDNEIRYILTETSRSGERKLKYKFSGCVKVVFPNDPGRLLLHYSKGNGYRYHVFATDYMTYAGIFVCQNKPRTRSHKRSIILLSRTRTIDGYYLELMMSKLREYDIDLLGLTPINQTVCLPQGRLPPEVSETQPPVYEPPVPVTPEVVPVTPEVVPVTSEVPFIEESEWRVGGNELDAAFPTGKDAEEEALTEATPTDTAFEILTDFPLTGIDDTIPVDRITDLQGENSVDAVFQDNFGPVLGNSQDQDSLITDDQLE